MPKPFLITIQVEESALGHVMRILDRTEGVVTFDFDMDNQRTPPKHNGAGKPRRAGNRHTYAIKGHDLVLQILYKANKPMTSTEMDDAFEKAGRARSAGSALYRNKNEGLITVGDGGYALTKTGRQKMRRAAAKEA